MITDIMDRVLLQKSLVSSMRQIEEKELAKTRFLAAAGHDLRQPLAAANLFIDALKLTAATPKQESIILRLDQSIDTFKDMLDTLLNVSKLEAGVIKPEYAPIDVVALFRWLEQNFEPLAVGKHLGFRLHFPLQRKAGRSRRCRSAQVGVDESCFQRDQVHIVWRHPDQRPTTR